LSYGGTQTRTAAWLVPLLVAVLALALPAAGEAAGPGAITGTVTGEGAGTLTGVKVCAELTGGAEEPRCDETRSDGTYEISGLAEGKYLVSFRPPSTLNFIRQFYADSPSELFAQRVSVGATTVSGIDAELQKGAKISGTVTAAATGFPVAGVIACAYSSAEFETFACGETNAFGAYVIQGLTGGYFEVEFFPTEGKQEVVGTTYPGLVPLVAGGEATGVDVALPAGGQVGGTVRLAATGAPVKGVQVCITEAGEAWPLACLRSPASGGYRFTGLWSGEYKVVFSPEASDLVEGENWEASPDSYPTQWWNGQSTFAAATPIGVTAGATVNGIDGSLGPGPVAAPSPPPATPPATAVVKPKPLKCKRNFVRKTVKGKARCVKRHTPKRHHRKHRPKPRAHAAHR
jgi:hypothetical protein